MQGKKGKWQITSYFTVKIHTGKQRWKTERGREDGPFASYERLQEGHIEKLETRMRGDMVGEENGISLVGRENRNKERWADSSWPKARHRGALEKKWDGGSRDQTRLWNGRNQE